MLTDRFYKSICNQLITLDFTTGQFLKVDQLL